MYVVCPTFYKATQYHERMQMHASMKLIDGLARRVIDRPINQLIDSMRAQAQRSSRSTGMIARHARNLQRLF
jgi:hypothetical protein